MASFQKLCLRWNNHTSNLLSTLDSVLSSQLHSDVTLACQGEIWHLHRLVLSASSSHFAGLLAEVAPGQSPLIIVDGPPAQDIAALIRFIYHGEVSVDQDHLNDLLKTASALKIKGLAEIPVVDGPACLTTVASTPSSGNGNFGCPTEATTVLPPKKARTSEYCLNRSDHLEEDTLPLNLSNKRSRLSDSNPKEYSFKKRILQEEYQDYGKVSKPILTNVIHRSEEILAPVLHQPELKFTSSRDYAKDSAINPPSFKYVQHSLSFSESKPIISSSLPIKVENQPEPIAKFPKRSPDSHQRSRSPYRTLVPHVEKPTSAVEEPKPSTQYAQNNTSLVSSGPSSATSNTSPSHREALGSTHGVPLIKRFKNLESVPSSIIVPSSSKHFPSVPVSLMSVSLPTSSTVVSSASQPKTVYSMNLSDKSPEGTYQPMMISVKPPSGVFGEKLPFVSSSKIGNFSPLTEYKFISVKHESSPTPPVVKSQTEDSTHKAVIVQCTPDIKEEVVYMKSSPPLCSSDSYPENLSAQANPILSSAFLSGKNLVSVGSNLPNTTISSPSFVKINSSMPMFINSQISPQMTSSPQQTSGRAPSIPVDPKTVSPVVGPPLRTAIHDQAVCNSVSGGDSKNVSLNATENLTASTTLASTSVVSVTTTTMTPAPVTNSSMVSESPNTTTSQRVSVNMRTFKEEWKRQLLVDYDPRSNMSICMLCFTTFKSYDGPRKNTYVKHAKRFHPTLDDYSEEERDMIINNYEKQYKYDVDMQKEVNKSFRCGGGVSGSCGNRSNKVNRSGHLLQHFLSTSAVTASSGSSTGSNSLPGSRPDTDGEEDAANPGHPGKSRSGTPDSDTSVEIREPCAVNLSAGPSSSSCSVTSSFSCHSSVVRSSSKMSDSLAISSPPESATSSIQVPPYGSLPRASSTLLLIPPSSSELPNTSNNNNNNSSTNNNLTSSPSNKGDSKARSKLYSQVYSVPVAESTRSVPKEGVFSPPSSSVEVLKGSLKAGETKSPGSSPSTRTNMDSSDGNITVTVAAV